MRSVTFSQRQENGTRLTSPSPFVLSLLIATLMIVPLPPASAMLAPRVRPLSNISRAIVDEAVRRSPTIKRLITDLQQLDVLVFVEINLGPMMDRGTTSVLTSAGGFRMLRIVINAALDPARRIEVLGHELQHALEIAQDRQVVDDPSLRDLYLRIGYAMGSRSFETDAARQVELDVRRDLSGATKSGVKAAPGVK